MAECLGRRWKKQELISLIGDPQQIARITRCTLDEGKAAGVQALQVNTGGGLQFTVLPGRGMDIAVEQEWKGEGYRLTVKGKMREAGKLPLLEGQSEYRIRIRFEVVASEKELDRIEEEAKDLATR
jgi:hypothetical protein